MIAMFFNLAAEQSMPALVFYLITWFAINKKDGKTIKIKGGWHVFGFFISACIAGLLRFVSIFIVGGDTALNPQGDSGYGMFFFLLLPIIIAIVVIALIKSQARRLD
jgi:hypothetical protein